MLNFWEVQAASLCASVNSMCACNAEGLAKLTPILIEQDLKLDADIHVQVCTAHSEVEVWQMPYFVHGALRSCM